MPLVGKEFLPTVQYDDMDTHVGTGEGFTFRKNDLQK